MNDSQWQLNLPELSWLCDFQQLVTGLCQHDRELLTCQKILHATVFHTMGIKIIQKIMYEPFLPGKTQNFLANTKLYYSILMVKMQKNSCYYCFIQEKQKPLWPDSLKYMIHILCGLNRNKTVTCCEIIPCYTYQKNMSKFSDSHFFAI